MMIKRFSLFAMLLFEIMAVYGQELTRAEADSLWLALKNPMPDTDRRDAYFRLAEFYMDTPGKTKQDRDSVANCLQMTDIINARLKSEDMSGIQILIHSLLAKEGNQEKQGKELLEEAVRILGGSKNKYYLGRAYFHLSDYYRYTNRTELVEKIRLVELAVQCFAQSKYIEPYANSLKYLADLYEINEQRSKVLETLNLSLKMYKSIHYPKLSGVYVLLNRYYYLGGNYKLALDYCLLALSDAERAGDSSLLYCQINNYMAITLVHLKERERATGYFKIALQIAEKYHKNNDVQLVMNNMVRNYIELKKPQEALELMKGIPKELLVPTTEEGYILSSLCYASIYFELKKYPETGAYTKQIFDLIKIQMPRAQVVNDFYNLLIRYYLETRQYALAGIYLQKIDSLSRKIGDPARINENYYLTFRLDTATGSLRPAIANLLKFQHLHDSLFDETSNRQMEQMEVEYEAQKNKNELKIKDQDIVLLNQTNQLQQSRLERASLIRNFIIAGVGLLLVIIALLYRQFRIKQKSNHVISGKNEILQRMVIEKEWLLKEIHHRVKNNLQIVMSLLDSQSEYIDNLSARTAIQDSQHRVRAISLLHQKLYNSENLSSIDMSLYIRELVSYLAESFTTGQRIRFEFNIEPLDLDVSQAIPLSLILNEAITNSIKYAFPNGRNGAISISLRHTTALDILLVISDNGIGIPTLFNDKRPGSLGMSLMVGLSEDLGGKFSIDGNNGTTIKMSFARDAGVKRPETAAALVG